MSANVEPILGAIAAVGAVGAAVSIALAVSRHNDRKLAEAWRPFATRRGFDFSERTGPWYASRGPSVRGVVDGVPFVLEKHVVRHGRSSHVETRILAPLDAPLSRRLVVCPRSFGQRLKYAFGPPLVDTASPSFDARLMIRCAAREEALELVDEKVRAKLITFPRRPKVDCKRGIASISWRGTSLDPAVLDAACELIAALCRSRDANSRDRKLISV